jgi:hypothetical protein
MCPQAQYPHGTPVVGDAATDRDQRDLRPVDQLRECLWIGDALAPVIGLKQRWGRFDFGGADGPICMS